MRRIQDKVFARWYVLLGIVILLAALLVYRWTRPPSVIVEAAAVSVGEVENTVSTVGTVIPAQEFVARASFSGAVEKIHVELGQHVHVGQLVISMKDPFAKSRVSAAIANLQSVEVNRENVERNGSQEDHIDFASELDRGQAERSAAQNSLDTLEKLQGSGDASPAEITAAKNRLQAAKNALEVLHDRMTKRYSVNDQRSWDGRVGQSAAALEAEQANLSNIDITSPIAGVVYLIPVSAYDFVPAGAELVDVANLSDMNVMANFDEPDIGKLHDGQSVTVAWEGKPGHNWHGHILHAPLAVAALGQRKVGACSISIDDANEDLPAHTTVTVTVSIQRRSKVLTIPHEALRHDSSGYFVYRILSGKLLRAPVNIGVVSISQVEITNGLAVSDQVALHLMNDGQLSNNLRVQIAE